MVASRYDRTNPPSYASSGTSLNYEPYFDYSNPRINWGPSSFHPGGAMHTLGDGSVHFLSETIDWHVYVSLSTRAGGETLGNDAF